MTEDQRPTQPPSILTTPRGASLAYRQISGAEPGVLFLHGLYSDMTGTKPCAIETWCRSTGRAFVCFEQQGHGSSSGNIADVTVADWAEDTAYVLDTLFDAPAIIVGSSLGGWLMLLAALARPEKVAGLIGIAAAPDFTRPLTPDNPDLTPFFDPDGNYNGPSSHEPDATPTSFSARFIREGNARLVLERTPVPLTCPVRLIQGIADPVVPWETALRIQESLAGADVRVTLVKDGGHRLSRPQEIALLLRVLEGLTREIDGTIPREQAIG